MGDVGNVGEKIKTNCKFDPRALFDWGLIELTTSLLRQFKVSVMVSQLIFYVIVIIYNYIL